MLRPSIRCRHWHLLTSIGGMLAASALVIANEPADTQPPAAVSYYRDVRPILQSHCQGCHQPAKASGSLQLTDAKSLLVAGDSELHAIVPGKPDESYLIEQITPADGEAAMPPGAEGKKPLAQEQIALIRRWIEEGAQDDTPPSAAQRIDANHPPVYRGPPVITSLDWSPDGALLAVAGYHEVLLHKADGGGLVARLVGMSERIESVRFSPDGTKLAVTGGRPAQMGEVQIWDIATRALLLSIPVTHDSVYGASWSPDGKRLAFGATDSAVRVIDVETGEQVLYQSAHDDWVLDTIFSTDGSHLATVGRDMTAKLIEVPTQRFIDNITSITPGALKGGIQCVERHPLRDEILFGGADGTPKIYRMHRTTKREIGDDANLLWELPPLPGRIFSVDISSDGQIIAAASSLDGHGHVHIYRMDAAPAIPDALVAILYKPTHQRSAEEKAQLQKHFDGAVQTLAKVEIAEGGVYAVALSPDGRRVAAAGSDGTVRLIDSHSGALVTSFVPVEIREPESTDHIAAALQDADASLGETRLSEDEPPLPESDGVVSLAVEPATITLDGPARYAQLILTAELASGANVDVTRRAKLNLSAPIANVNAAGLITPTSNGHATLTITFGDKSAAVDVQVIAPDSPAKPDFIRDISPILARAGCNQGTCHGAQAGKNGFKLSLRGYDPVFDVRALADDLAARRVNVAAPEHSLMLLKPTAAVPHQGGQVLKEGSRYYEALRQWIADGAHLNLAAPRVTGLTIAPSNPVVEAIGARQQVRVVANYSDGTQRDVTREAFLESGNTDVVATVAEQPGLVEALRRGEAPVLVRYEGNYAATTLTVMGDRDGFVWEAPPVNNHIDELVAEKLRRTKTLPSPLTTDHEFVRRVYLDLTGLPPTPDEIEEFVNDPRDSRAKRDALIDRLIGSDEYIDYWTNKWADLLLVNRKFLGIEGATALRAWIRAELAANTPHDQFVHKILTASGSTKDNPAAAYFKILRTPEAIMENTTHLFLATRFNCNKCHDHPFERWTQDQYYHLAAYFAQVTLAKDPASGEATIGGTAVEASQPLYEIVADAPQGEVKHERTGEVSAPAFPFSVVRGSEIVRASEVVRGSPDPAQNAAASVAGSGDPSTTEGSGDPRTTEGDPRTTEAQRLPSRREELANWLTSPDNPYFARSHVNRIWGYLTGRGIIEPLDDIRAGNPPTNPELLDYLTREFIDSGFDTRRLMALVCKSRTYQLSVETNRWNEDDSINFSHARARRLPAEVLYDAIYRTTGATSVFPGVAPGTRAATLPDVGVELPDGFLGNLGRPSRESACECERSNDLQLGPVMALVSGPTVAQAIADPNNAIARLAAEVSDNAKLVGRLFLQFLSRPAKPDELQATVALFDQLEQEHAKLVVEVDAYAQQLAPQVAQHELERQGRLASLQAQIEARRELAKLRQPRAEQERLGSIAKAQAALAEHEKELIAKLPEWEAAQSTKTPWHVLDAADLSASFDARFTKQSDGSVFVDGANDEGVYHFAAPLPLERVTGIRLEALTDDRLPSKGPGRAGSGNFVLTELSARWQPDSGPLKLVQSWDFADADDDWQVEEGANVVSNVGARYVFGGSAGISTKLQQPPGTYLIDIVTGVRSAVALTVQWTTAKQPTFDASRSARRALPAGSGGRLPAPIAFAADSELTGLRIIVEGAENMLPLDAVRLFASDGPVHADVKLQKARATFSQRRYGVPKAIDGKTGGQQENGWAIAPQTGRNHSATFELATPLDAAKGRTLELALHQNYQDNQHSLGRFRISVTDTAPPFSMGLPPQIAAILTKPAAQRSDAERETLLAELRKDDKRYNELRASLSAAEQPLSTDPQVAELEAELAKANQPLPIDPKLQQLRRALALSEQQLQNKRLTAAQDIAWALINSPAFLYNH